TVREINRPAPDKWAPVRDPHPDRFPRGQVGHLYRSPERERGMSRGEGILVIDFATGREVALKPWPIPGGHPELPGLRVSGDGSHERRRTRSAADGAGTAVQHQGQRQAHPQQDAEPGTSPIQSKEHSIALCSAARPEPPAGPGIAFPNSILLPLVLFSLCNILCLCPLILIAPPSSGKTGFLRVLSHSGERLLPLLHP